MKNYLLDITAVAFVLAAALFYYYGHSFFYQLMLNGPSSFMHLAVR